MTKYGKIEYEKKFGHLYQTPQNASLPLIRKLSLEGTIWEPFAGKGLISQALISSGYNVISSDLFQWGYPLNFIADIFELTDNQIPKFDHIISNPPYGPRNRLILPIVKKLLALRGRNTVIALLLPSEFDHGSTRAEIFPRSAFYRGQIKVMDRIVWFGDGKGTENHTWHVWGPSNFVWKMDRIPPVVDYMRVLD